MKKITYLFCAAALLMLNPVLRAQPTDLFISEYVEGSSNNKALEIYNGTSSSINLATGQYILQIYFNGSTSSTSLALSGTIASGSVYVVANTSAVLSMTPDLSSSAISFNGDDAIVLRKGGVSGTVLDVIGQVGTDPGTQWGSNDTSTLDRTIRRKISICQGDVNTSNSFYTSVEWDGYPQNTFSGLGTHSATCGSTVSPSAGILITPTSLSFTSSLNVPSSPLPYTITGNSLTAAVDINFPPYFELALNSAGPFSASLSIPSASFISGSVTVFVRYNPISIGTNSGIATHTSSTYNGTLSLSGVALGLTPIAQIQGTAAASSFSGQVLATQGLVTADFQGTNELGGFFIQDPIGDSNPLSSEGIFIFNTSYSVNVGDVVTLSGLVDEYFNKTQIKSLTSLSVNSTGGTITPVSVTLPFATMTEAERWEGMSVQFTQTLSVTEVYSLARFGEVALSVNGRLFTPTNFVDPNDSPASGTSTVGSSNVTAVLNQQDLNDRSRILLDDRSSVQNPTLVPYVDPTYNTLRCGSTLNSLIGIMDYDFGVYRIQPVISPVFNYDPRPAVPTVGAFNVKAASFNVLNYFNGNGSGGGFPTSRGANTSTEFTRQRTKIIEAIKQINADVVGLMEMENDGNSAQSAIQDLVDGLNTSIGATTYTFVADPTFTNGGTGTDEIKVAMIYKPAVLTPTGSSLADANTVHNRPPLAQTFLHSATSEKFSIIVNHFKSKGCSGSSGANTDQNDGQSCYNDSRKNQASALLSFISSIKTLSADNDVLVMGDLNAYEQEDPIDLLLAGGLNPLITNAYSYVFNGQSGSLDHALGSTPLLSQVTGAAKWHINADEPIGKDYNQEFNPAYMYDLTPFRSSDHDPVIIGLYLQPSISISVTATSSVSCFGLSTGAVTISASGGDGPLSYSWSPSGGNTLTATGLFAGNYTVSVSDGTNTTVKTVTISQPSLAITSTITSQSQVSCFGGNNGSATVGASGGTGSYTYSWMPAGGSGSTGSSLSAGLYTVITTDANLCSVTKTLTISQAPALTLSVVGTSSVSCNGLSNGSATVLATGGTGSFTYSWSPGASTGASSSSLSAGIYTVLVGDANACTSSQTLSVLQPSTIAINVVGFSSVTCNGFSNGSATISANGGTGSYTYSWSPGASTGVSSSSLSAGVYTVLVRDANLCTSSQTLSILQPSTISVSVVGSSSVTCNGFSNGSATISASGGTGSYTYSWSPSGGTAASSSSLSFGIYTITTEDANVCIAMQTVSINQPASITLSVLGSSSVSCNGLSNGSATVLPTGGTGSFTYSWSPGTSTGASAASLAAGVYTVLVGDANLCTSSQTLSILQASIIAVNVVGTSSVTCNGFSNGSATIAASGGTGGFTYSWSPAGGAGVSASSLSSGLYTVTVNDANLCIATQTVNITQPTAIVLSIVSSSNVSCNGLSNGAATVASLGGTGSFTYSWSPLGGTGTTASLLPAGVYTLIAKDGNLCSATKTISITQPAPIDVSTTLNGFVISANANSSAYQWINCSNGSSIISGATSQTFTPAMDGNYAVIITQNGCSDTSACSTIILTGIVGTAADLDYFIYPNPTNDLITIQTDGAGSESITIFNNLGQVIHSSKSNKKEITIDLSEQAAGLYFVRLETGKQFVIKKIIKTN
jgi:uncharacterized protein